MKFAHWLFFILPFSFCVSAHAQTELEYKMEIGGMLGTSTYQGDAGGGLYKHINLGGGAIARYNLNPRMALKFDLAYGGISGDASKGAFPADVDRERLKFKRSLIDVGCQYEMHFWAYGTGASYKNTHRLVPYIQLGLGFTATKGAFTMNIPVGFGVKYKVANRVNVGLDWTVRFSLSDKLDGIGDLYGIKSGFLKNRDSYCWTMLYVSYDFWPRLRKCNND
ncbi:MAG: outer membrane beta-barrel protein [Bacteroidaceae bacterium]|nr:outer membrane beta-barrel protein [Bacteroidaceae bacterium]